MTSILLTGQKLFVPSRHLWLRAKQIPTSLTSSTKRGVAPSVSLDIGITHRGLEDIGDVQSYEFHHDILAAIKMNTTGKRERDAREHDHEHKIYTTSGLFKSEREDEKTDANGDFNVNANTTILKINWDAHLITAADELYHTVWETVSESTAISTPIDGNIAEINTSLLTKQKAGSIYVTPSLDEDTTLFTLRTSYKCIEESIMKEEAFICCEDEYEEIVQTSERGRFYEEEGEAV